MEELAKTNGNQDPLVVPEPGEMCMRRNSGKFIGDVISTVTVAVLFFVILMLVVFSAISYQRSVEISDANGNTRAVLSYIITAVKANEASRVTVQDADGMQVLVSRFFIKMEKCRKTTEDSENRLRWMMRLRLAKQMCLNSK